MRPRGSASAQTSAARSSSAAAAELRSGLKVVGHMAISRKTRSVMVVSAFLTFSSST
uniref:Uncharacterized protein n=1 Tax=Picea sitchensis TaxID=3332 RepID=A9NQ97_PICSI|nr:unknown [Picea sitchensis]